MHQQRWNEEMIINKIYYFANSQFYSPKKSVTQQPLSIPKKKVNKIASSLNEGYHVGTQASNRGISQMGHALDQLC